jgi:hypothetical protein
MTIRKSLNDLLPNTEYAIRMRAVSETAVSEWSTRHTFTTIADTVLPDTPTNVTWTSVGDSFHGEWDKVTTNEEGTTIAVSRYEIELVANSITKYRSVLQVNEGVNKVTFDLAFEENRALFSTPQPSIAMRVRAVESNEVLKSEWANGGTAENAAPNPPTSVVATAGLNTIGLTWVKSTSTDVIGYNVYASSGGALLGFTAGTTFNYQTATYSAQTLHVTAVDKFLQESTPRTAANTVTPTSPFGADTTAPPQPAFDTGASNVTVNTNGVGAKANLVWTIASPPSDLAGFYVRYRRTTLDTAWQIATFHKDDLTGQIELQHAYQSYDFQIKSFDWSNNESNWTGTMAKAPAGNTPPAQVTGLTSVPSIDSIRYTWNEITDPDLKNYEVTFSTSSTFVSGNITFYTGRANYLTVSGLTANTPYYARVRAIDTAPTNNTGPFSTTDSETTLPYTSGLSDGVVPSASPAATATPGIGYIFVTWPAITNNDPVTYEVHISTSAGFNPTAGSATMVAQTPATSILLEKDATGTALAYGTNYYVRIIAKDRDGAAATAGTVSAATQPAKAQLTDLIQLDINDITNGVSDSTFQSGLLGKNKVTYSASAPTTSSPNIAGDVWFVRNAGTGIITAQWEGTGGTGPSSYTWTAKTLDNAVIANLDAGKINVGTLSAGRIGANTITTEKLAVGDLTNYAPNYGFEDADYRAAYPMTISGFSYVSDANSRGGSGYSLQVAYTDGVSRGNAFSDFVPVTGGDEIYMSWWQRRGNADFVAYPAIRVYAADKTTLITGATALRPVTPAISATNSTWIQYEGRVTIPTPVGENPSYMKVYFFNAAGGTSGNWRLDDVVVRQANRGLMIVDGTLSATSLKTSSLGAATITLDTGGIIKTSNNEVTITNTGIAVTGTNSSITATALTTGTFQSGNVLTVNGNMLLNGNLQVQTGGYIKSTEYTGTTQLTNPSGLGWYLGRDGLRISSGMVTASALTAGTLGSSTGIINIAAGASLVLNGGYIKSTNNGGTTMATAVSSGAGFYLGDDGLFIGGGANGGQIKANALISDTLTSTTITLGTGGIIQSVNYPTTGFRLTSTSLDIPDGTIESSKIIAGSGRNLLNPGYADFEYYSDWFMNSNGTDNNFATNNTSTYTLNGGAWNNSQCIKHIRVGTGTNSDIYFGPTTTSYLHPCDGNKSYTYSVYMKNTNAFDVTVVLGFRWDNATFGTQTYVLPANSSWTRYVLTKTSPVGTAYYTILHRQTLPATDGTFYFFDGAQVEETNASGVSPIPWRPPGQTTIDGYGIKTGSIRSANNLTINGVTLPYWNIDTQGAAQFGNLLVRGASVVGSADAEADSSFIQSYNYKAGSEGWIIRSDGKAEFRNVTVSGVDGEITANVLKTGTLGGGQTITLDGKLVADGSLGERVEFGGEGFSALGAYERAITNIVIDGSGNMTITTGSTHSIAAGDTVRFVIKNAGATIPTAVYNQSWVVSSETATTLVFSATGLATLASTAINGVVQSADSTDGSVRPELISLPTDGSRPNIISGTLNSTFLNVSDSANFRREARLAVGATLYISSGIVRPSTMPIVTNTIPSLRLEGSTSDGTLGTIGRSSKPAVFGYDANSGFYKIYEYNATTGKLSATITMPAAPWETGTKGASRILGFSYNSTNDRYVVLYHEASGTPGVYTINPSTSTWGANTSIPALDAPTSLLGDIDGAIGIDYSNAARMVVVYRYDPAYGSGRFYKSVFLTFNGSGTITAVSAATTWSFSDDTYAYKRPEGRNIFPAPAISSVAFGPFDFGVNKFVLQFRQKPLVQFPSQGGQLPPLNTVFSSTGVASQTGSVWNDGFDGEAGKAGAGIWWNGTVFKAIYADTSTLHVGTHSTFKQTSKAVKRYIAHSWRRPSASKETEPVLNPVAQWINNRAYIKITIDEVPYSATDANSPDRAVVYIQDSTAQNAALYSNVVWEKLGDIISPYISLQVDPSQSDPATHPVTTNGFTASVNPGSIVTTSGNSFWKGDDSARFYKLALASSEEASTAAGNKPALRIGNIDTDGNATGQHLRIDSDEINSMATDSTVGTLYLNSSGETRVANAGAGTFRIGNSANGRLMKVLGSGFGNLTTNATGFGTLTHNLGISDLTYAFLITSRDNNNSRVFTVTNKTTNAVTIRVNAADGTTVNSAANQTFDWIAIGW